jgi:transposase
VHSSATTRSTDFIALFEKLDGRFGPRPRGKVKPVVVVLNKGPIHTSKASAGALAVRNGTTVEWLPRYAPELNDIERSWKDLKRSHLAHQTFHNMVMLDIAIHEAVDDLNQERRVDHPCDKPRIAA